MLTSLALFTVIGHQSTLQDYVVQRGEDTFDSRPFNSHKETVQDPNDPNKQVEATVSYFWHYGIHEEDEPDDYEVVRTVRVRPESPAKPFTMSNRRVRLEDDPGNRTATNKLAETFVREGIPTADAPIFERSMQAMRKEAAGSISPIPVTVDPNKDLKPGGWTVREYGYDVWVTDLHVQLVKKIEIPGQAPRLLNVGSEQIYNLWEYWTPVPLIRERFIPDPTTGSQSSYQLPESIGGVKFSDEYATLTGIGYVPPPRLRSNETTFGVGVMVNTMNAGGYMDRVFETIPRDRREIFDIIKLTPGKVNDMLNATAAQGKDMNSLTLSSDLSSLNMPPCGSEMVMPPGTIWIPDRPGYQSMMSTTRVGIRYSFDANIDGGEPMFESARTHCLNKDLKEPELGVRYFPFMSNDDGLVALADMTSKNNFRGPWDQVRTWLYTDKVSFDEANDRLMLGATEGQYTNNLFDVLKVGGFTAADLKNKKLFDPKLLSGAGALDKAFDWVAMQAGEIAGKEVRKWIEGMPEEVQRMLKSPANDMEKKHVPRLMKQLLGSLDLDTRMGALTFLDKSVGAEAQLKDKIGDLRASVFSVDEKEATLAKKVAERYVTPTDTLLRAAMR